MNYPTDSSAYTAKGAKTFTLFNRLPKELREMIWEWSLPAPRLITICLQDLKLTYSEWFKRLDAGDITLPGNWLPTDYVEESLACISDTNNQIANSILKDKWGKTYIQQLAASASIPVQLLVSFESNEVASEHYLRAFSTHYANACTYFNFEQDILYLRYDIFSNRQNIGFGRLHKLLTHFNDKEENRKVQNLALLIERRDKYGYLSTISDCLRVFSGVKSLTIVIPNRNRHYNPPGHDPDTSLIEPIDIDGVCKVYESHIQNPSVQDFDDLELPLLDFSWAMFSLEELSYWKTKDNKEGGENTWILPETISYKICFDANSLSRLRLLKRRAENAGK